MYCPPPFLASGGSCFYDCSKETGYKTVLGLQPRCVRNSGTQGFDLRPVNQVPMGSDGFMFSMEELMAGDRTRSYYEAFNAERTRAKGEVAILNRQIGKDTLLRDAFQEMQDAENARDQAPEAYQKARTAYYTLLKGDGWVNEERERVAKAEVDPVIQKYQNQYTALDVQLRQQTQAYDTMRGIKDKVFRVKDDLTYSANLLMNQVQKVRSKINLERRKDDADAEAPGWFGWVDMVLNILLVVALGVAIWLIVRKLAQKPPPAFTQAASPT